MRNFQIIRKGVLIEVQQETGGGYTVSVPALPGCLSYGESFEQAMEMIEDAIAGWLKVAREKGLLVPSGVNSVEEAIHASAETKEASSWVWDSPRVKAILERPEGTPIDLSRLTEEERDALARDAKGMWADHPYIKDSVEWVRDLREGLSKSFREDD